MSMLAAGVDHHLVVSRVTFRARFESSERPEERGRQDHCPSRLALAFSVFSIGILSTPISRSAT